MAQMMRMVRIWRTVLVLAFANFCTSAYFLGWLPSYHHSVKLRDYRCNRGKIFYLSKGDPDIVSNKTLGSPLASNSRKAIPSKPVSQSRAINSVKKPNQWKAEDNSISKFVAWQNVNQEAKIEDWMQQIVDERKFSNPPIFASWSIEDQVDFVKLLQQKAAFKAILLFLQNVGKPHVKVFTTAAFALALSRNFRGQALSILSIMDANRVEPTALSFIAILGSADGPVQASLMMKRFESYNKVKLNAEVFNSAIFACRRVPFGSAPDDTDWQVALAFFQKMRRKRIQPTTKTYYALMLVLSRTGKVHMAKSLFQQMRRSQNLHPDDRVWAAVMNVCSQAGDFEGAIELMNDMQMDGRRPTLRHWSGLLKAFAKSGQDIMAIRALSVMLEGTVYSESLQLGESLLALTPVAPDIVALNTVMTACSKAGNFEGALTIFNRIKAGEFRDPLNQKVIVPDRITYHSALAACSDPESAKKIVTEMRLSRRNRSAVVPPTNVTYALAVNACQKAEVPDLEVVQTLLKWAIDDGVTPSVFMYASAIWAAQKSGNREKTLEFFIEMQSIGCRANDVAYNGVIAALCDKGDVDHALIMYNEMKEQGLLVSGATFKRMTAAIHALEAMEDRLGYFERIAEEMEPGERRVHVAGPVIEALISLYGSLGLFEKALRVFKSIVGRVDAQCLRAILSACSMASPPRWTDAISILHTSDILEGVSGPGKVDQLALSNAIMACSIANEYQEALNLLQLYGLGTHERSKSTASISIVSMNALIAACGRGNRADLAMGVFNEMQSRLGLRPDVRSYRNMVIACNRVEHGRRYRESNVRSKGLCKDAEFSMHWWECAISLLRRMREENLVPDRATYSAAISSCEAAGKWQRALGVLQMMINDNQELDDETSLLDLYCFNAALSACEKGGAWVEALELYERMIEIGGTIHPNFITLSSLVGALDSAGQKELAQNKYEEGRKLGIVQPWRWTQSPSQGRIKVLDLHKFSAPMAKAAIRSTMDSYIRRNDNAGVWNDLVIVTGKGLNSFNEPILQRTVLDVLNDDFHVKGKVDVCNTGRVVVDAEKIREFARHYL